MKKIYTERKCTLNSVEGKTSRLFNAGEQVSCAWQTKGKDGKILNGLTEVTLPDPPKNDEAE